LCQQRLVLLPLHGHLHFAGRQVVDATVSEGYGFHYRKQMTAMTPKVGMAIQVGLGRMI
jgi:hypothetical protein